MKPIISRQRKKMQELDTSFFARDTLGVAQELLGKILIVGSCSGRIIEVEAYKDDEASHAFMRTQRSAIMYDTYGHVYVYFIYGMYCCLNFTTELSGKPGAVLIRSIAPIKGISEMKLRRKTAKVNNLCSGPGKLCMALRIDLSFNNSVIGSQVRLVDDGYVPSSVVRSGRIGISKAQELDWRFTSEHYHYLK